MVRRAPPVHALARTVSVAFSFKPEANQARLAANTRPGPHKVGGAVREGSALLQGLASCGHCGRRLKTHYSGRNTTPGYHCAGKIIVEGRGC